VAFLCILSTKLKESGKFTILFTVTYYVVDESSISFLNLVLYKDANFITLQFSTYQKPLNKYLYIPFESFHPVRN